MPLTTMFVEDDPAELDTKRPSILLLGPPPRAGIGRCTTCRGNTVVANETRSSHNWVVCPACHGEGRVELPLSSWRQEFLVELNKAEFDGSVLLPVTRQFERPEAEAERAWCTMASDLAACFAFYLPQSLENDDAGTLFTLGWLLAVTPLRCAVAYEREPVRDVAEVIWFTEHRAGVPVIDSLKALAEHAITVAETWAT